MRAAALVTALLLIAVAGCGGGTGGPTVNTSDNSAPDSVTMDAHIPTGTTNTIVTVSRTSGDKSFVLSAFPTITLIASARDPESAIKDLRIEGETMVICRMNDEGQSMHGVVLKKAPLSGPASNPIVSLNVDTSQLRGSCPQGFTFISLTGKFSANATNGVDLKATTATFSFQRR
jgi:hypothetical protein